MTQKKEKKAERKETRKRKRKRKKKRRTRTLFLVVGAGLLVGGAPVEHDAEVWLEAEHCPLRRVPAQNGGLQRTMGVWTEQWEFGASKG
eukprot:1196176-Rhodomonas_salina.1